MEMTRQDKVQCPETIVRKDEEPMNTDFVINETQNKLFIETKCVHELILSQFVLVFIPVNTGLECSLLRSQFDHYHLVARNITMPPSK